MIFVFIDRKNRYITVCVVEDGDKNNTIRKHTHKNIITSKYCFRVLWFDFLIKLLYDLPDTKNLKDQHFNTAEARENACDVDIHANLANKKSKNAAKFW